MSKIALNLEISSAPIVIEPLLSLHIAIVIDQMRRYYCGDSPYSPLLLL